MAPPKQPARTPLLPPDTTGGSVAAMRAAGQLWQDAARTIPAVRDGDPVAVAGPWVVTGGPPPVLRGDALEYDPADDCDPPHVVTSTPPG